MRSRLLLLLSALTLVAGFCPQPPSSPTKTTTTTRFLYASPEEAASALTEFMAKAHVEKIAAMARVEAQYKEQIGELKARVEQLEAPTIGSQPTSQNSFAFPATNKALAEKVVAYQTFISQYILKVQADKQKTVKDAEAKIIEKYEAKIARAVKDAEAQLIEKYEAKIASLQEVTEAPLQ
jgi:hypothetical protein